MMAPSPLRPAPDFAAPTVSERLARLESVPAWLAYLLAGTWLLGAAAADHWTGRAVAVGFLYVPAVAAVGWLLGHRAGLNAAAAAAVAGLLVDWPFAAPADEGRVLWNVVATGLLLAAAGWLAGEIRAHREWLRHVTHVDGLTGLYNRASFLVAVDTELVRQERFGGETSVVCIDLEGLRALREAGGHAAVEHVVKALAQELGATVRRTDLVACLGGDEFAVLLRQTDADATAAVAQKLGESLASWAQVQGHAVRFGLGWASAPFTGTGMGAEQLLERATAMLWDRRRAREQTSAPAGIAAKTATA